ncbi:GTP-binding protein REM 2 [Microcaecilia unicolor]|uniref:GTP-binding protein n=1 Tax=Microcaecilia unicolor TaxID=1415580 RepID=A0A6P7WZ66_9AMPH|nr:GTP-binding protein REM 2 [Microcaecilia unicolor]
MTLNRKEKVGGLPQLHRGSLPLSADSHRRGSMPVPYKHQLSRGQAVDELEWPPRARGAGSIHSGSSDSIISSESAPGGIGDLGGVIKVVLLGDSGVGKTALAEIFGGLEDSLPHALGDSEDAYERKILVDGEEGALVVYDVWEQTDSRGWMQENCLQMGNAYLIIFSVTDRRSFSKVTELLLQLRTSRPNEDLPIIVVGNKSDLVRSREISLEEGRGVAVMLNCKYVETSAALHHNTRELFEGVVRQFRLRRSRRDRQEVSSEQGRKWGEGPSGRDSRRESITKRARRFLHGLVAKNSKFFKQRSKSCHDLSVL